MGRFPVILLQILIVEPSGSLLPVGSFNDFLLLPVTIVNRLAQVVVCCQAEGLGFCLFEGCSNCMSYN